MDESPDPPHTGEMEAKPWQQRARAAGLSQRILAALTGRDEKTISMQMRGLWGDGVPQHLIAVILAWEVMTSAPRLKWFLEIEAVTRRNLEAYPPDRDEDEDDTDSPERG